MKGRDKKNALRSKGVGRQDMYLSIQQLPTSSAISVPEVLARKLLIESSENLASTPRQWIKFAPIMKYPI
jgi:hypothetical protein